MSPIWVLLLALVAGGPVAGSARAPRFSVLSSGVVSRPDGRAWKNSYFTCIPGEHPAGVPVLLLPKVGSEPCRVTTGEQGAQEVGGGDVCTALVGAEKCAAPLLALVGASRASYSPLPLAPMGSDRIPALGKVARASGVLEALVKATLKMGGPETTDGIEALPSSAHVISGMEKGPAFVRFTLKGGDQGPIVVVTDGKASGPFESICDTTVTPFLLDGITYVRAGWGCCECGGHTDAVFAVERGGLRRVYETNANSN